MYCPHCGSENVRQMSLQNHLHQMACNNCHHPGTYTEFGVDKKLNVGLATQYEGSILKVEQPFFEAQDAEKTMALTVHEVESQCAVNIWVRHYGQWLKFLLEKVLPGPANFLMLKGEIYRLASDSAAMEHVGNDQRTLLVMMGLQSQIQIMQESM